MNTDESSGQLEDKPEPAKDKNGGGLYRLAAVFLVAAIGFAVYGAMIPNNPPDLIVGSLVAVAGVGICVALAFVFIICGWLVELSKHS
jgi:hypothetical protein